MSLLNALTREQYLAWRAPRIGTTNPQRMTNPVWSALARSKESAYGANERFGGPSSTTAGPAWSAMRYGQSETQLPDGRIVRIGGEHEDAYDADFFIYNDVFVDDGSEQIEIFGYPIEVFEPTDFHSATLVAEHIFVIGNTGYSERRRAHTAIARLDTTSWQMNAVDASGPDPGWLSRHSARLVDRRIVVTGGRTLAGSEASFVDNADDWSFDTTTFAWTRLTSRGWQQWELTRADGEPNQLWRRGMAYSGPLPPPPQVAFVFAELGDLAVVAADRPIHATRYTPPLAHEELEGDATVPSVHRRRIEGAVVRYVEEMDVVRVVIEGHLPSEVIDTVLDDACKKLSMLEKASYVKRRVC